MLLLWGKKKDPLTWAPEILSYQTVKVLVLTIGDFWVYEEIKVGLLFHSSILSACVCIWGDGKGCEHELVLTSLQLLSDIRTGSHCHMTEVSAPCPIAQRSSYVCCQHKYRPSHSYTCARENKKGWADRNKARKETLRSILLSVENYPLAGWTRNVPLCVCTH